MQIAATHVFDLAFRRSPWSLDQLSKGLWSLDPVHKNFNTGYTSDYHLSMLLLYPVLKPGSSYHGMIDMSSVFIIDGRVLSCLSNLFFLFFFVHWKQNFALVTFTHFLNISYLHINYKTNYTDLRLQVLYSGNCGPFHFCGPDCIGYMNFRWFWAEEHYFYNKLMYVYLPHACKHHQYITHDFVCLL